MKIAAYQAPLLESGSMEGLALLKTQIARCEAEGVEILCCPEAVFGGLADYADNPYESALNVESGQLEAFLSPLSSHTVSLIVGFTELTHAGQLYNSAAIFHHGRVTGLYRKVYPAINHSIYAAGGQLPIFTIGALTFGIIICNDANYLEPARVIAAQGAAALFIPTNNCLPPHKADVVPRARGAQIARAVENGLAVIAADVAGCRGSFVSYGSTAIIDRDGTVMRASKPLAEDLLVAEIEPRADKRLRGWDASKNPAIVQAFIRQCYPGIQV